jgi:hypothetical protein
MKKSVLIIITLPFMFAFVLSIAGLSEQNQQNNNNTNNRPTPLHEMTATQREHSKLYRQRSRKDLRNTRESVRVILTTPFIEPDGEKTTSSIEQLLQRITCEADAIVIGTIEKRTSQFTEDGGFIFTDHDLRVQEIVRNKAPILIQPNETIVITRPGGSLIFDGKIVSVIDKSFAPLLVGNTYLLFLRQVSTGAFQAVNSESSFELQKNQVRRLTAKKLPYNFSYDNDAGSFLAEIRTSADRCAPKEQ